MIMSRFCRSALTAAADPRVLHLDGHLAAVLGERGAVDLADRRRRDRLLVEALEELVDRIFEVLLDHPAHLLEGHGRGRVAELGELALELLAVLLGHEPDVQERHHLAELHRGALHRPEHRHDLLGRLQLTARHRLFGGLLVAREVGRAGAELLDGLARRQRGHGRRAPRARARDLLVLARHSPAHATRAGHENPRVAAGFRGSRGPRARRPRLSSPGRCRRCRPPSGPRPWCRRRSRAPSSTSVAGRSSAVQRLGALRVEAPPDADEGVGLPLPRDGGRVRVARVDDGLLGQLHERPHDRLAQVLVGAVAGCPDAADRVLEERVAREHRPRERRARAAVRRTAVLADHEREHPGGVAGGVPAPCTSSLPRGSRSPASISCSSPHVHARGLRAARARGG